MTRKMITRLYIINKIMNGFLMKYDKLFKPWSLLKPLQNTPKANKICAYPLKFVSGRVRWSGVLCNELSRRVPGSSCHPWWTWRWDEESWGLVSSSTLGFHPPCRPRQWCTRMGSQRRAPCVARFRTLENTFFKNKFTHKWQVST